VRGAIAWFARNHVAANLLMGFLIVGGLIAAPGIPQKTFPEVKVDWVDISVVYPGASPEEVEKGVCIRIEEEVQGISGIENILATAGEGSCFVQVELMTGMDQADTISKIRNRVEAITTLPEDAERPIISRFTLRNKVIDVAISGQLDAISLKLLGQQVREEIAALPGVTQVELTHTSPYEISIEVSEETLRRHGLSFDQVAQAVRRSSLDLPGGSIKTRGGEITLRATGQAYRGGEFEEIVVLTRSDGTRITLGEVARVVDGLEESDIEAEFDGRPAVVVTAFRVGDQDAIEISDRVVQYVAEASARMPEGVELTVWQDSSETLRGRLDTLFRNGRNGLLLVLAVLALFLRFRLAFWVSLGVPVAFVGTLLLLPWMGVSINPLSLFAFIVVLGILVDDAIVVGESVYTHEEQSGDRQRAAIEGTQEVSVPVIFGVLTTVVAFCPLLAVEGPMGQMFFAIGAVVIACLFFSVIESQLVLPAHLAQGRSAAGPRDPGSHAAPEQATAGEAGRSPLRRFVARWRGFQGLFATGLQRFARQIYQPSLGRVLDTRYLSVSAGIAALILALALVVSGRLDYAFFPPVQADHIAATLTLPQGTPVERTHQAVRRLERAAETLRAELDAGYASRGDSLVRHLLTAVGTQPFGGLRESWSGLGGGSHVAEVVMELVPAEQRSISTEQVRDRWRDLAGEIPDAVELSFQSSSFRAGEPINVQLEGDDIDALVEAAERLKLRLAEYPGVLDIADSFRRGKRELKLDILPEAEPLGLTLQDLARQVRQAFYGEEVQRIQRGRDEVRVMLRYPPEERRSLGDLENMRIRTAEGIEVPFSSVARAELGQSYSSIMRFNRKRIVNVTAKVDRNLTSSNEVNASLERDVLPRLFADYPQLSHSLWGEQREQTKAFTGLFWGLLLALVAIYALLAVPLRSYFQPLIIMAVIPFGLVGAIVGHMLMGRTLSFMSAVGVVALSGVVVNASLVLVVTVNRRRAEGLGIREAVTRAGMARFRPIVLTSLTTFAGLTPLMFERSLQAQYLIPMAISLAFGVMFATFITLLLVPCGYLILDDLAGALRRSPPPARRAGPGPRRLETRGKAA
jgi:multidrug efflux pump subunit AcrB